MFSQLLVNGLVLGSGFVLIAIGHTIIFGLMKIANFAHGELYMLGAFLPSRLLIAGFTLLGRIYFNHAAWGNSRLVIKHACFSLCQRRHDC